MKEENIKDKTQYNTCKKQLTNLDKKMTKTHDFINKNGDAQEDTTDKIDDTAGGLERRPVVVVKAPNHRGISE